MPGCWSPTDRKVQNLVISLVGRNFVVLGFWFFYQLFEGVMYFGRADLAAVAVWTHIGGFIAGVLMALLLPNERRRQITYIW